MKRRGNGDDHPGAPPPDAPESPAPEEGRGEAAPPEPSGLQPVEGGPQAPLTREQVEELRRERDELMDQLLRKRAEFDNFRKRVERDRQAAGLDAVAALLKDLVPTIDNLDRALASPADAAGLLQGVDMIRRGLLSVLESKGVVVEDPTGAPFDPSRHQALSHEPAPGHAEGTVVEVYQKGYSFKDRLLRPALVKVAKQPAPDTQDVHSEPEKVH
ncbi:MAG TPA: nucleotide exchange factor GrpE [Vicinamibacteria bacterium]|nr:nucleotide exchange factor GrpE [Vicinamibacteria bacterium]